MAVPDFILLNSLDVFRGPQDIVKSVCKSLPRKIKNYAESIKSANFQRHMSLSCIYKYSSLSFYVLKQRLVSIFDFAAPAMHVYAGS